MYFKGCIIAQGVMTCSPIFLMFFYNIHEYSKFEYTGFFFDNNVGNANGIQRYRILQRHIYFNV